MVDNDAAADAAERPVINKPAHLRIAFSGLLNFPGTTYGGGEKWAWAINCADIPAATIDSLTTMAGQAATAWINNLAPFQATEVVLSDVKVSRVAANGHVVVDGTGALVQGHWVGSMTGTLTEAQLPAQTSLAVSLTTARAGATGKGRFFLPLTRYGLASGGVLVPAVQLGIRDGAKGFLNQLKTVVGVTPVVASSKGYLTPVTGVKVGAVPDVIRSRRRSQRESYSAIAL